MGSDNIRSLKANSTHSPNEKPEPTLEVKPQIRIVILDYPKLHLNNDVAKRIMGEMLTARQSSFHRTDEGYILMDKNDMLATHILIYDTTDLFAPKILSGLRLVHETRCKQFGLCLPLDENLVKAPLPTMQFYKNFKAGKDNLVEVTGWYVDSNFSYAKTKLDLAQILFFTLTTHLLRRNITYLSGAVNELYKTSHWVARVGHFEDGYRYAHPLLPHSHKLTLIESFNKDWLKECFGKYRQLIESRCEILPEGLNLKSLEDVEHQINEELAAKALKAS